MPARKWTAIRPVWSRILTVGAVAIALAMASVPGAWAAPDYAVTFGRTKTSYAWSGGPATSLVIITGFPAGLMPPIPCDTEGIHDCEDLLIRVRDISGTLSVGIDSSDPNAIDIDLYLYESNSNGDVGAQLDTSGNVGPTEGVSASVEPGYYLARIDFAIALDGTYTGEATLTT